MQTKAWLPAFVMAFWPSMALAQELVLKNAQLCSEYDASTRECGTLLSQGGTIDPKKVNTLFLRSEVASEIDREILHVWIRTAKVEPDGTLFAPRIDIYVSGEREDDNLLALERVNPWMFVLRSAKRIKPIAKKVLDYFGVPLASLIVEAGLGPYLEKKEEEGVDSPETDVPNTREQYQAQAMFSTVTLPVKPSDGYRTFSSKKLDPQVHAGDWHAVIFTNAGERLWSGQFSVASGNN